MSFDYVKFEEPYHKAILEHFSAEELAEIHSGEDTLFQSKSLDKNLDYLTITSKGRLTQQHQSAAPVAPKDRPYFKTPQWNVKDKKLRAFYRSAGSMTAVLLEAKDTEHHGYLHLCVYRKKKLLEYRAKFTDGQLVWIKKLEGLT